MAKKRKQVSNEHLSMLAVLSVVVAVAGTLSLLSFTSAGGPASITGAAIVHGNASTLITESLAITITDSNISFTTGYVNGDNASAWLTTENEREGWSADSVEDSFEIRNDGNEDINVTVKFSGNWSHFICDGIADQYGIDCGVSAPPNLTYYTAAQDAGKGSNNGEASSCGSGLASEWTIVNDSSYELAVCAQLYPDEDRDQLVMELNVTIPDDAQGEKRLNVTFTSYSTETP